MQAKIYDQSGKETGTTELPVNVFGLPWNSDLVHQVVTSLMANQRTNRAAVKNRGDVSGGGKKPWQQKGTGRARHGSSRSPLWRGGGATHGPNTDRVYRQKINIKMKTKALSVLLSRKWRDGEIVFLDQVKLSTPKTKQAAQVVRSLASLTGLSSIADKKGKRLLLAIPERVVATSRSFRNLPGTLVRPVGELNLLDVITYRFLVITEPTRSLSTFSSRLQ